MKKQLFVALVVLASFSGAKAARAIQNNIEGIQLSQQASVDFLKQLKEMEKAQKALRCSVASRIITGGIQNSSQKTYYQTCLKNNDLPTNTPEDKIILSIEKGTQNLSAKQKMKILLNLICQNVLNRAQEIGRYPGEPVGPVIPVDRRLILD